jgi:hypothetical protein
MCSFEVEKVAQLGRSSARTDISENKRGPFDVWVRNWVEKPSYVVPHFLLQLREISKRLTSGLCRVIGYQSKESSLVIG